LTGFSTPTPPGPLQQHAQTIATLCEGDDLEQMVAGIQAGIVTGHWWQTAQTALTAGSPTSARLGFELQRRAAFMTLAETFQLEYISALHCATHGDFAEGIRALLIDKDHAPHWNPATLTEANANWAKRFFMPPHWPENTHPLAKLSGAII